MNIFLFHVFVIKSVQNSKLLCFGFILYFIQLVTLFVVSDGGETKSEVNICEYKIKKIYFFKIAAIFTAIYAKLTEYLTSFSLRRPI